MTSTAPGSEFSRPIDIEHIGEPESVHDIAASPEERAALARRFGLLAVDRLEARVRLCRTRGGAVLRLAAAMTADVTQACVVTLEPVPKHIEEEFVVLYGRTPEGGVVDLEVADEADHEPWPGGPLDIGEAVAQELALALDPYPRAAGAAVDPAWQAKPAAAEHRPFASLAKLKNSKGA